MTLKVMANLVKPIKQTLNIFRSKKIVFSDVYYSSFTALQKRKYQPPVMMESVARLDGRERRGNGIY